MPALGLDAIAILAFIGFVNFVFWRWLLAKFIKDNQRRLIFTWFATIGVTPLIYMGFIAALIFSFTYIPERDFNKTEWLANRTNRHEMARDILDKKMLIGKDTNSVKQLLGQPNFRSDSAWMYDMGMGGGGLGFLFHQLNLRLVNGKIISAKHGTWAD